jgi:hypothetical protein
MRARVRIRGGSLERAKLIGMEEDKVGCVLKRGSCDGNFCLVGRTERFSEERVEGNDDELYMCDMIEMLARSVYVYLMTGPPMQ